MCFLHRLALPLEADELVSAEAGLFSEVTVVRKAAGQFLYNLWTADGATFHLTSLVRLVRRHLDVAASDGGEVAGPDELTPKRCTFAASAWP